MSQAPTANLSAPAASPPAGVLRGVGPLRQPPIILLVGMLLLRTALLFLGDTIVYGIAHALGSSLTWSDAVAWSDVFIVAVDLITVFLVAQAMRRAGSSIGALLRAERWAATSPGDC